LNVELRQQLEPRFAIVHRQRPEAGHVQDGARGIACVEVILDDQNRRPPSLPYGMFVLKVQCMHRRSFEHPVGLEPLGLQLVDCRWSTWGRGDALYDVGAAAGTSPEEYPASRLAEVKVVERIARFAPAVALAPGPHAPILCHMKTQASNREQSR
jgi:hypothetical protein